MTMRPGGLRVIKKRVAAAGGHSGTGSRRKQRKLLGTSGPAEVAMVSREW